MLTRHHTSTGLTSPVFWTKTSITLKTPNYIILNHYPGAQLQVGENYSYMFNLGPNICKHWCLSTHFISNNSDLIRWYNRLSLAVKVLRTVPANTRRWPNVGLMLVHTSTTLDQHQPNIGQRLVFAGVCLQACSFYGFIRILRIFSCV